MTEFSDRNSHLPEPYWGEPADTAPDMQFHSPEPETVLPYSPAAGMRAIADMWSRAYEQNKADNIVVPRPDFRTIPGDLVSRVVGDKAVTTHDDDSIVMPTNTTATTRELVDRQPAEEVGVEIDDTGSDIQQAGDKESIVPSAAENPVVADTLQEVRRALAQATADLAAIEKNAMSSPQQPSDNTATVANAEKQEEIVPLGLSLRPEHGGPKDEIEVLQEAKVGTDSEEILNPLDVPPRVVEIRDNPRESVVLSPESKDSEYLRCVLNEQRSRILELPSREEGLDMERVHAYRKSMGAPNRSIRVLDAEDYEQAMSLASASSIPGELGKYLPSHGIIVVKRDLDLESLNDPTLTESILIHEIAHSSCDFSELHMSIVTNHPKEVWTHGAARQGLKIRNIESGKVEGTFLEEGYAEYERGIYVANTLGRPDGYYTFDADEKIPLLPKKYYYFQRGKDGVVYRTVAQAAKSAHILDSLIQYDPKLLPALRAARHSPEGLREVSRRINAVAPQLYQTLRRMHINESDDVQIDMLNKVRTLLALRKLSS